jgi:hypothetical protein
MFGWLTKPNAVEVEPAQPVIDAPDPHARWEGRYRIVEYSHRNGQKTFKIQVWIPGLQEWRFAVSQEYAPLHWDGHTLQGAEKECERRYGREIVNVATLKALPIIEAQDPRP